MFQKTSKTFFYMKIMVCKITPGGAEPFLVIDLKVPLRNCVHLKRLGVTLQKLKK